MYINRRVISTVVVLFLGFIALTQSTAHVSGQQSSPQQGIGIVAYYNGLYSSPAADQAIDNIADTGAEWVNILVTQYQFTLDSTSIYPTVKTPTDADLVHIIAKAKSRGLKVMLKPHIDVESNESLWRGRIGQNFNEASWAAWFSSYRNFIGHYATLSQAQGVEMLVIGTEFVTASQREAEWRGVASHVRGLYSGPITYSANHSGEEVNVNWWDAVDYIGVSAYYDLTDKDDPTVAEIKAAWQQHISTLNNLSQSWNRDIIFTELGYRSSNGNNTHPWCHYCTGEALDLQEQADSYQAFYEAVYNQPWFSGIHWWGWDLDPEDNGICDDGYSPHLKPAENVIRSYYGASQITLPTTCGSPAAPTATPDPGQPTATPVPPQPTATAVPPTAVLPTAAPTVAPGGPLLQEGIGIVAYYNGLYSSPAADMAVENIAATGAEWLNILVTQYQFTADSTNIYPTEKTPTDNDLIHIIAKAKSLGLKVMLKPHIDIQSNESIWRGRIGQNFNDATWATWFSSYRNFIGHYADLSQAQGVDMLVIGTELVTASLRGPEWRAVASEVRNRYSGPITYSANHSGEEVNVNWWDAVDYIGVSGYYDLTDKVDPTVAEIKAAWQQHLNTLNNLSQSWNRDIIFTELGYRSSNGNNTHPWCHYCTDEALDLQEQADSYQAFYETVYTQPWFAGIHWWGWDLDPEDNGICDDGYSPHLKPAENVIRSYYGGSQITLPTTCGGPAVPTATPGATAQPTQAPTQAPPAPTATPVPPQPTQAPTQAPPAGPCGGLRQEAEAGTIGPGATGSGAFTVGNDGAASGGQYVLAVDARTSGAFDSTANITYCVNVTTPGTYGMRARAMAPDTLSNSLYLYINGAPVQGYTWHLWATGAYVETDLYVSAGDNTATAPLSISLPAGEHQIAFAGRESGSRLDWFELVLQSADQPPAPTPAPPTPTAVSPTAVPTATAVVPAPTTAPTAAPTIAPTATVGPNPTVQPSPTATSVPGTACGGLQQEAEDGTITGLFTVGSDGAASGGKFVHVANGQGNRGATLDEAQKVSFCVQVDTPGTYHLVGWTYGESGYDNSFYVRVNGLPVDGIVWHTPINTQYRGEPVVSYDPANNLFEVVSFELAAGQNTVEFLLREDGPRLDKMALEPASNAVRAGGTPVAGADASRLVNDIGNERQEAQPQNKLYLPLLR